MTATNSNRFYIIYHNGVYYVREHNNLMPRVEKVRKEDAIKWIRDADAYMDKEAEANKKVNDQLKAEGWQ